MVRIDWHVANREESFNGISFALAAHIQHRVKGLHLLDSTSTSLHLLVAMASWVPQPGGLQEILQTIHESTDTQNADVQRDITTVSGLTFISSA